jgi:hypothetical protein
MYYSSRFSVQGLVGISTGKKSEMAVIIGVLEASKDRPLFWRCSIVD